MASQAVFGKRTSAPKRATQGAIRASSFANLIHEVAPDIILRELSRSGTTWTPELYRRVISVLLRSSTLNVAERTYRVLQNATQGNGANRLGFTALTSIDTRKEILYDILKSAVFDQPLTGEGNALSFYTGAGNGATDADEYDEPERDGLAESSSFGPAQMPLRSVRRRAVCNYLRHLTSCGAPLIINESRLRGLLVNDLCVESATLHEEVRDTLQHLLQALSTVETVRGRDGIVSSLVMALATCASKEEHQASVGSFLHSMYAVTVQHDASLVFLQQRFGVKKGLKRPLTVTQLADYVLDIEVKTSRNKVNKVLPALVAALSSSWLQTAKDKELRADDMMIVRMLSAGEELIRKCNPPKNDATWLRMMLHDIKTVCSL